MRREIAPKSEDMKHPKSRPSSRPSRPRGPSGYGPRKKPPATAWPGGPPPRVTSVVISPSTPRETHTVNSIVRLTRVGRRARARPSARAEWTPPSLSPLKIQLCNDASCVV